MVEEQNTKEVEVVAVKWEVNDHKGRTLGHVKGEVDQAAPYTALTYDGYRRNKPVIVNTAEFLTVREAAEAITAYHFPKPNLVIR